MNKAENRIAKTGALFLAASLVFFTVAGNVFAQGNVSENLCGPSYDKWRAVGKLAAETALDLIEVRDRTRSNLEKSIVVLSNAGYANVNEESTEAALDGLAEKTGTSRGRKTLVEIHSAPWTPLWFSAYDKGSGRCSYLQVDASEAAKVADGGSKVSPSLFGVKASERIDAEYLFQHPDEYKTKFESKIFGGNEFRIVTIANAVAAGAPACAVRAFEFHDHYCPGVTSGILMAEYLRKHFAPGKGKYFVHSVQPWCKEDALLALLNATPGKRSYAVSYPTDEEKKTIAEKAQDACTVVYRQKEGPEQWEGVVLAFVRVETQCPKTGNVVVDKLCADMWYLKNMDKPENFVKVVKSFELPEGVSPQDWTRPGKDPLAMLGLLE